MSSVGLVYIWWKHLLTVLVLNIAKVSAKIASMLRKMVMGTRVKPKAYMIALTKQRAAITYVDAEITVSHNLLSC